MNQHANWFETEAQCREWLSSWCKFGKTNTIEADGGWVGMRLVESDQPFTMPEDFVARLISCAAVDHYLDHGDVDALDKFIGKWMRDVYPAKLNDLRNKWMARA